MNDIISIRISIAAIVVGIAMLSTSPVRGNLINRSQTQGGSIAELPFGTLSLRNN